MAKLKGSYRREFHPPKEQIPAYDEGYIRHYFFGERMLSDLGINEETSERGRDAAGKLRFYELTAEGDMKDPFEDGTTLKSKGFLDKVAQGKILVFPSGEQRPVQMQILKREDEKVGKEIRYSKPLDSLPHLPKPQEPAKLGPWTRFANWITGGRAYRAEKAEYQQKFDTYQRDMQSWQQKQNALKEKIDERTPEVLAQEMKQYEAEVARREENKRQKELAEEREKFGEVFKNLQSENPTYSIDQYRNTLKECYGPKPVLHKEFCFEYGGHSHYEAEFKVLTDYSDEIKDAGITDEEFTAIAMFGAFDPEIGGKWDPDKKHVGLTPEQALSQNVTMFTDTVNAGKVTSRPAHGSIYPSVVQPARKKTVEAIEAYKKGNPAKLAEQIGRGLHMLSNHYGGKPLEKEKFLSITSMMGDALNLLNRNPMLKAETEKAMTEFAKKDNPEATPEELKAQIKRSFDLANGQKTAVDLTRRNEKAKGMLKAESLGICKLSQEQRKEYIDDRLAFETVNENTGEDIYLQEHDKTYQDGVAERLLKHAEAMKSGDTALKNRLEAAGQMYSEDHIRAPKAFVMMGASDKTVGAMVDRRFPNRAKLYELSGEKLLNALDPEKLLAEESPYAQKQGPAKAAPEKQKTAEKTHTQPNKGQSIG